MAYDLLGQGVCLKYRAKDMYFNNHIYENHGSGVAIFEHHNIKSYHYSSMTSQKRIRKAIIKGVTYSNQEIIIKANFPLSSKELFGKIKVKTESQKNCYEVYDNSLYNCLFSILKSIKAGSPSKTDKKFLENVTDLVLKTNNTLELI